MSGIVVNCPTCSTRIITTEEEAKEMMARATPPGAEAVPEGTVELLGKICTRFREIEYQHELNHPHIGDGILYEMLEDLSNTLTDPVRIVPEAEYQRMRKAAKGPA